jgi:hypothetical protein
MIPTTSTNAASNHRHAVRRSSHRFAIFEPPCALTVVHVDLHRKMTHRQTHETLSDASLTMWPIYTAAYSIAKEYRGPTGLSRISLHDTFKLLRRQVD